MANATGKIFSNAMIKVTTGTCGGLLSTSMYDLSGFTQQVRVGLDAELRDNTTMGMSYRSQIAALRSAVIEGRLLQQFDVAAEPVHCETTSMDQSLHSLLLNLYEANTKFLVFVRPDNSARLACNPEMWMPASLQTHVPVDGAVADLLVTSIRFNSQGQFSQSVTSSA